MKIFMVAICFIITVSVIHAASFNCRKAVTPFEKTICANESLSQADGEMGSLYFSIIRTLPPDEKTKFRESHITWLNERLKVCPLEDTECLVGIYRKRIELYRTMAAGSRDSKFSGCFANPHPVHIYNGKDWVQEEGEDTLTIKNFSGDSLFFSLETVATNAHMCSIEGYAKRNGDHFLWVKYEGPEDQCAIRIYLKDDRIVIDGSKGRDGETDGIYCREYCGMRAVVDNIEFLLKTKKQNCK